MTNAQKVLILSLVSLIAAQIIKSILWSIKEKKFVYSALYSTGSMPSSHSAFVATLVAGIYQYEGYNNYFFVISLVLALIVLHDAMGIRLEASKHAQMLNRMIKDLSLDKQKEFLYEKEFKEPLGHIPAEVFAGVALGIIIAVVGSLIF